MSVMDLQTSVLNQDTERYNAPQTDNSQLLLQALLYERKKKHTHEET
jgi:hypothetical protein